MNLRERYKSFKAWQHHAFDWSFDVHEHHLCANCGNDFVGNHCPYCSQKAGVGKVSWKSVLQSAAEVWGLHNRSLLYSLWQLMFRSGHFISDYINGKRQVSFPPVKMLIIMGLISLVVDHLFNVEDAAKGAARMTEGSSPLVSLYFAWVESSPGWGWLSFVCFFLFPTWCLFRYSPRNTKHSLPQGFFIQVFMSIEVLIVDDLADFFTDYFYLLLPLCYFYAYRQLFGYRFWGNFWRVMTMLVCGFLFAVMTLTVCEWWTGGHENSESLNAVAFLAGTSMVPVFAGMLISKLTALRRSKKALLKHEADTGTVVETENATETGTKAKAETEAEAGTKVGTGAEAPS